VNANNCEGDVRVRGRTGGEEAEDLLRVIREQKERKESLSNKKEKGMNLETNLLQLLVSLLLLSVSVSVKIKSCLSLTVKDLPPHLFLL